MSQVPAGARGSVAGRPARPPARIAVLALLLALAPHPASAAPGALRGTFADTTTNTPLDGVQVRLTNLADSADVRHTVTAEDGRFVFLALPAGTFRLEALRMGYVALRRTIRYEGGDQSLELRLRPLALALPEVVVKGSPPPAVQRADTTEFSSGAVKTHPDATAEELVAKMPGMSVDNSGAIKSNGETIQEVLVDGKPYFGSDPALALRNLPADVIEKIQVYDRMSDQSEFSGFDDGQTIKTMNVILRSDRPAGFGRAYAGEGQNDRYQAGGNVNVIHGSTRLAAIGMANDINQQNFSSQDVLGVLNAGDANGGVLGGASRKAGSHSDRESRAFLVAPQDGITTTNALGAHLAATLAPHLDVTQSWFFNDADNHNLQDMSRNYSVPKDSVTSYSQTLAAQHRNRNQRLEGRIDWLPDSALVDQPRLYFQSHVSHTALAAANDLASGVPASDAANQGRNWAAGHSFSNHLLLRHRFANAGRTVSLDLGVGNTLKDGATDQHSFTDSGPGTAGETLDRSSDLHTTTSSLSARMVYTEPVGRNAALAATLAPGGSESVSERRGWRLDPGSGTFSLPDTALTNLFRSRSTTQSAGLAYLFGRKDLRFTADLAWQRSTLTTGRTWPGSASAERVFYDPLPSLMLNQNLPHHRNLRLSWVTSTRMPTVGQLQDVMDNGNPLVLTTGNPDLRPAYVNTASCRYSATDPARSRSLFLLLSAQLSDHSIGNSTWTAPTDTVISGVLLRHGAQLVSPANVGRAWNANLFGTYSWPVSLLRSLLNLNTGVTWSRTPGLVDGLRDRSDGWAISQGVVLASNVSSALDFTVAYTGTYNFTRTVADVARNSDYFTQAASVRLDVTTRLGVVVRQEISHTLLNGVTTGYAQDVVLWNSSLGEKLFRGRVDLRMTASDVLAQNRSTSRTVTETYVQDTRNQTLAPYLMLTATYSWK